MTTSSHFSFNPDDSPAAVKDIIKLVREAAEVFGEGRDFFLQALQYEIQTIPGACVALSIRDIDWARRMSYGDENTTDADLHETLLTVAKNFVEGHDVQDRFHTQMREESQKRNISVFDMS